MKERLSWTKIREFFAGQWVELVDFEWDWKNAYPTLARVRHHASDRKEVIAKIQNSGEISDSVVVYIGATHSVVEHDAVATM